MSCLRSLFLPHHHSCEGLVLLPSTLNTDMGIWSLQHLKPLLFYFYISIKLVLQHQQIKLFLGIIYNSESWIPRMVISGQFFLLYQTPPISASFLFPYMIHHITLSYFCFFFSFQNNIYILKLRWIKIIFFFSRVSVLYI